MHFLVTAELQNYNQMILHPFYWPNSCECYDSDVPLQQKSFQFTLLLEGQPGNLNSAKYNRATFGGTLEQQMATPTDVAVKIGQKEECWYVARTEQLSVTKEW